MNYELHPLCTLFPRMDGEAFATLVADIKANGLNEPITLHNGMILDGGNRYRACIAAGVDPVFDEFGGKNPVTFVLSANLHRRHLTAGQSAAIVSAAQDWARANAHGGARKSDQGATLHLDSAKDRAAVSGSSVRTQKDADKVARADPKLAVKVAHGETTLAKAVEKVTGKKRKAAPQAPPSDDFGPDDAELAMQAEQERIERESFERLVAADDKLAAALAENKRLAAALARMTGDRDRWQNRCAEVLRRLNAAKRKAAA